MIDEKGFEITTPLKRGDQILYVPSHIEIGDWNIHRLWHYPNGVQPGFVSTGPAANGGYFCRYWQLDEEGKCFIPHLRTLANSELTPNERIVVVDYFNQRHVEAAMKEAGMKEADTR